MEVTNKNGNRISFIVTCSTPDWINCDTLRVVHDDGENFYAQDNLDNIFSVDEECLGIDYKNTER